MKFLRTNLFCLFVACSFSLMASPGTDWVASHAQPGGEIQNSGSQAFSYDYQSTAVALLVWEHFDELTRPAWSEGLNFLNSSHTGLTEEISYLATLLAINETPDQLLIDELLSRFNEDGGIGQQSGYQSSVLDTAQALQALNRNNVDLSEVWPLVSYLVSHVNTDDGYGLSPGFDSDVYVSSHVILALSPHKNNSLEVANQLSLTSEYLIQAQLPNGGWGDTFVEAIAIMALVATNHPYSDYYDSVVKLRNNKLSGEHWDHDVFTTSLALVAEDLTQDFNDPANTITVSGVVISSIDQQPISQVSVIRDGLNFTEVYTDSSGRFFLSGNINPGNHSVSLEHPGFIPELINFSAVEGETINLGQVVLVKTPDGGIIRGRVWDAENDIPMFNATIEVESDNSTWQTQTTTDGYYQLAIPAGPFTVSASALQRNTVVAGGILNLNETIDFSPTLSANGVGVSETSISGRIIDAENSLPLQNVTIEITSQGVSVVTGSDGSFNFTGLPTGSLELQLSLPDYLSITLSLISGGGDIDLGDIAMSQSNSAQSSTLLGTVVDSDTFDPIHGVVVSIKDTNLTSITDINGWYLIQDINTTNYDVEFNSAGHETTEFHVTSPSHTTTELNVSMTQVGTSALQILEFLPEFFSFIGSDEVEIDIELFNNSGVSLSTRLYLKVTNQQNQVVALYPIKDIPYGGTESDAAEIIPPFGVIALQTSWNTRFQEPGNYSIELLAYDVSSTELLKQAGTNISILPVKVVSGSVNITPEFTQYDPLQPIEIQAELNNTGNDPIGQVEVTADVYLVDKKDNSNRLSSELINVYDDPLLRNANLIRKDSTGNLIIFSALTREFVRFKTDETFESMFTTGFIRDFHVDSNDSIWTINTSCQLHGYDQVGSVIFTQNLALSGCDNFELLDDDENFYIYSSTGIQNFNKNTSHINLVLGNSLKDPQGMIHHSDGRFLIADGQSNSIYSYENSELSLLIDGLNNPHGIVEDTDGSLIVANYGSDEVIRIDLLNNISTITDQIEKPYGLAVNPAGGYFVGSQTNNKLYQLESDGSTSVIYDSFINQPTLITSGNSGDVYIYNSSDRSIIRRLSDGVVEQITSTPQVVTALFVDQSNQLIIAMSNHIHRVEAGGVITQLSNAVTGSVSQIENGQLPDEYRYFSFDYHIGYLASTGDVTREYITTPFSNVSAVRTDGAGSVFVLDSNSTISQIEADNSYDIYASDLGSVSNLWVSNSGDVFISKTNRTINQIDSLGNETPLITTQNAPLMFVLDSQGDVFYSNRTTQVFKNDGINESLFVTLNYSVNGDIAIDHLDRIWVTHQSNNKVSIIDPAGQVTELSIDVGLTGITSPRSISLVNGTNEAWLSYRKGFFKINTSGTISDVIDTGLTTSTALLSVSNTQFRLFQGGSSWELDSLGNLLNSHGAFRKITDWFELGGEHYLLAQTPTRRLIKLSSINQLPIVVWDENIYQATSGKDSQHLIGLTNTELVEFSLIDQTSTILKQETNGSREKLAFANNHSHLIDPIDNEYIVVTNLGETDFDLLGLNSLQGLAVADDGLLYLTDQESIFSFNGTNLEIILSTQPGGYLSHHNQVLFKTSQTQQDLVLYDLNTHELNVRDIQSMNQNVSVQYVSDNDVRIVGKNGLVQFSLDGEENILLGSVGDIADIHQQSSGDIILASDNSASTNWLMKLSNNSVTQLISNQALFGVRPESIFEANGALFGFSQSDSKNSIVKLDMVRPENCRHFLW